MVQAIALGMVQAMDRALARGSSPAASSRRLRLNGWPPVTVRVKQIFSLGADRRSAQAGEVLDR
jgi:hypothetical protein